MDYVTYLAVCHLNYKSDPFQTCITGFATKIPTKSGYFHCDLAKVISCYFHKKTYLTTCSPSKSAMQGRRGGWAESELSEGEGGREGGGAELTSVSPGLETFICF